jgi:hypothetical protein
MTPSLLLPSPAPLRRPLRETSSRRLRPTKFRFGEGSREGRELDEGFLITFLTYRYGFSAFLVMLACNEGCSSSSTFGAEEPRERDD